jgi:PilZ domain
MSQEARPEGLAETHPNLADKRRHMRYRLVQALVIRRKNKTSHQATTSEISISGLSARSTELMAVGEEVILSPVGGAPVNAVIRRKTGDTYGFEFINPPDKVVEQIHILCRGLFPFRGLGESAETDIPQ